MATATQSTNGIFQRVKEAARGRWRDIVQHVGGLVPELLDSRHEHPCPKCQGATRFRFFDDDTGGAICNQCFNSKNGDGIAVVGWLLGIGQKDAATRIAEYLGLPIGNSNGSHIDPLAAVAQAKHVSVPALERYGGTIERGAVKFPTWRPDGKPALPFRIYPRGTDKQRKGLYAGKQNADDMAGVFLPQEGSAARTPKVGETWLLGEGVKDAAALSDLGFNALGMPTSRLAIKFCSMLRGCHVIIIPDRDKAGLEGAEKTASRLHGVAASVRIAALPVEYRESKGADVRDVLGMQDGESLVRGAIDDALPWVPSNGDRNRNGNSRFQNNGHSSEPITNAIIEVDDKEKTTVPLPMVDVLARIKAATGGALNRIDTSIFIPSGDTVTWLESAPALFGYLQSMVGTIHWHRGLGCVSREEVHAELRRTAKAYSAIATLPHEPLIAGHYYTCGEVKPGDGSALRELLERYAPASQVDQDLCLAAIVTPAWGGPVGARPCFLFTSEHGRGTGKSKTAQSITRIWSGAIDVAHGEDIGKLKTRLLSPTALSLRCALLDNVKSLRFSWAELEAIITSAAISGHRMYAGEASRPNTLTWYITLNGASLSTDMAQRCVIVKLAKPTHSATWEEETTAFIEANRGRIIADCIAFLRGEAYPLRSFSRWGAWEKDILQRLPEPGDAQRIILERQEAVDVEADDVAIMEEFTAAQLHRLGYSADTSQIFLPSSVVAQWYRWALRDEQKVNSVSHIIKQWIDEERTKRFRTNACRSWGRGFIWFGESANIDGQVQTDIEVRISVRGEKWETKKHES